MSNNASHVMVIRTVNFYTLLGRDGDLLTRFVGTIGVLLMMKTVLGVRGIVATRGDCFMLGQLTVKE